MSPEVKDVCHSHPLTFEGDHKNDGLWNYCKACDDPLDGPCYTCTNLLYCMDRRSYFLHKSCAELRLGHEIHHPMHPKHPLILTASSSYKYTCGSCHQNFGRPLRSKLIFYSCSECDFYLDLKCASRPQSDGHDHKFTFLRRNTIDVTCGVCGRGRQVVDGRFYLCTICQLIVHKECSYLPHHAKIAEHQHQLQLTWRFEDIFPKDREQICDLCRTNMDQSRAVYFCQECCTYIAHNSCVINYVRRNYKTLKEAADDEPWRTDDNHTQLESGAEIHHFSHKHPLSLMVGDHHDRIISCDGCLQPIPTTDAFYSCTQHKQEQEQEQAKTSSCHFYLHLTCAQLPPTMSVPGFNFKLRLRPEADPVDGVFLCSVCNSFSQGFLYIIEDISRYAIDVQCILLSLKKSLKHESHIHQLRFYKGNNSACSGCGKNNPQYWFSCTTCKFHLCFSCAKLPTTARHISDRDPLKLTFESAENELGEYYCDMRRNTRSKTLVLLVHKF